MDPPGDTRMVLRCKNSRGAKRIGRGGCPQPPAVHREPLRPTAPTGNPHSSGGICGGNIPAAKFGGKKIRSHPGNPRKEPSPVSFAAIRVFGGGAGFGAKPRVSLGEWSRRATRKKKSRRARKIYSPQKKFRHLRVTHQVTGSFRNSHSSYVCLTQFCFILPAHAKFSSDTPSFPAAPLLLRAEKITNILRKFAK
jgi:hypothetical protein